MSVSDKLVLCNRYLLHEFIDFFYVISVQDQGCSLVIGLKTGKKLQVLLGKKVYTFWSKSTNNPFKKSLQIYSVQTSS